MPFSLMRDSLYSQHLLRVFVGLLLVVLAVSGDRVCADDVAWSQERQRHALVTATKTCKDRFTACGGIIFWMRHDCFPCTANTAIIDFEGNPKPAAIAVGEIFKASK